MSPFRFFIPVILVCAIALGLDYVKAEDSDLDFAIDETVEFDKLTFSDRDPKSDAVTLSLAVRLATGVHKEVIFLEFNPNQKLEDDLEGVFTKNITLIWLDGNHEFHIKKGTRIIFENEKPDAEIDSIT